MAGWTTLTSKGQVTIPKEIREQMGLKPFDKLRFYIEDGEIKVRKAYLSLEELAGSVPPLETPLDDAEVTRMAVEDWVERYMAKDQ